MGWGIRTLCHLLLRSGFRRRLSNSRRSHILHRKYWERRFVNKGYRYLPTKEWGREGGGISVVSYGNLPGMAL